MNAKNGMKTMHQIVIVYVALCLTLLLWGVLLPVQLCVASTVAATGVQVERVYVTVTPLGSHAVPSKLEEVVPRTTQILAPCAHRARYSLIKSCHMI